MPNIKYGSKVYEGVETISIPLADGSGNAEFSAGGGEDFYDTFWDAYQHLGERKDYKYAFYGNGEDYPDKRSAGWTDTTFKPKYDMTPKNADYMFAYSLITDLVKTLEECEVTIDFSSCTTVGDILNNAYTTTCPKIDVSSVTNCTNMFRYAKQLKKAHIVGVKETQQWVNCFSACGKLEEFTIEGNIGQAFNMAHCNLLTDDSIQSIIDALATVTTTQTLTLHKDVKAKLTEAQLTQITSKNWTLA